MAELRLIDANALKVRMFRSKEFNCDTGSFDLPVVPWHDIEDAPTIDAVPVVRCRECEHFVKYDDDYRDEYRCDGYCKKIAYIMDGYYCGAENRNADDFCSHGEKMGGGTEG